MRPEKKNVKYITSTMGSPRPSLLRPAPSPLTAFLLFAVNKTVEIIIINMIGLGQLALDHSPHVRECSCFCLGQFAEHCQPEILDHSEEVLPIVFRLLDDATDNVKVSRVLPYGTYSTICVYDRGVCVFTSVPGTQYLSVLRF